MDIKQLHPVAHRCRDDEQAPMRDRSRAKKVPLVR
jgi:hypothetical protein